MGVKSANPSSVSKKESVKEQKQESIYCVLSLFKSG